MILTSPALLDHGIRKNIEGKIDTKLLEMSEFESAFLAGLLKRERPHHILEVGVSAGGTSTLILEAINTYVPDARLVSVDVNKEWYKNRQLGIDKKTGWMASEAYPGHESWNLVTGKRLPEVIETFDETFDFCVLDTVHATPGELLDFPVIIQKMQPGGIIVIHDITYHFYRRSGFSNTVLFGSCVGDKIVCLDKSRKKYFTIPNISAVRITEDTYKYIGNIFLSMAMTWKYIPGIEEFTLYYNFYKKYYDPDYARLFYLFYHTHLKTNNVLDKEKNEQLLKINKSIMDLLGKI